MRGKKPLLSKTKEEIGDHWSLITTSPPFITGHDAAASAPPHSQSFQYVGPTLWFLSILFHVNSFHKGLNQPFTSKLTALLGPFPILEHITLLGHPCLKWITSCFFYHGPPPTMYMNMVSFTNRLLHSTIYWLPLSFHLKGEDHPSAIE